MNDRKIVAEFTLKEAAKAVNRSVCRIRMLVIEGQINGWKDARGRWKVDAMSLMNHYKPSTNHVKIITTSTVETKFYNIGPVGLIRLNAALEDLNRNNISIQSNKREWSFIKWVKGLFSSKAA